MSRNDDQRDAMSDWMNSTPGQVSVWVVLGLIALAFVWFMVSDLF